MGDHMGARTAILYHKLLSPYVKVIETHDSRLTAVKFDLCKGLLVCQFQCQQTTCLLMWVTMPVLKLH